MLAHLRAVPWRLDQDAFKAWRQGLTGYPLVDAGGGLLSVSSVKLSHVVCVWGRRSDGG